MSKLQYIVLLFLIFNSINIYSQKKVLQTKLISQKIEIDGKLDENI